MIAGMDRVRVIIKLFDIVKEAWQHDKCQKNEALWYDYRHFLPVQLLMLLLWLVLLLLLLSRIHLPPVLRLLLSTLIQDLWWSFHGTSDFAFVLLRQTQADKCDRCNTLPTPTVIKRCGLSLNPKLQVPSILFTDPRTQQSPKVNCGPERATTAAPPGRIKAESPSKPGQVPV